jgi:hypothetical protein
VSTCKSPRAQLSRQFADRGYCPTPPVVPTEALPGSDEKVRTLIERAHSGQGLWHPSDRKWSDQVADVPEVAQADQFAFTLTLADLFQS